MSAIRILIADDHAIVREGFRTLITSEVDLVLVGEADNGDDAVTKALDLQPDLILMDLVMPAKDGVTAIREIKAQHPEIRILVVTSFAEDDKLFPAIKAGAQGYLLKDSSPQQLLQAIYDVYRGEASLHPSIALKVIRELNQTNNAPPTTDPLTSREVEVLKLIAQGLTNQQIADRLSISEWTVRTHVRNLLAKLHLANRAQAMLYALREGIVD
ncbi:MAG: response regulator transcription factor [Chloroflexi bacterium AL-W]|nr:response regulator transcription factor [Chloroflexi bacterium AL-N1]NOK67088.1 response regulator transcription factor [Chloroflexi bacterium AL-N10]NOK74619.1 response regulator transcription factor [Chloroflexi bacterium AL-N5]NOK81690.1 response regulator transcription factor [Chloroflexi bacterium AL-W]NOK89160.1 response regulator transcription factor [Chloroflexi bacterium AL-N15]